ncbi:hypothetical protein P4050_14490 [Pseudomonas aeruginosa]|nr:hypothetical protein [Pseudomonas aeruginosa]
MLQLESAIEAANQKDPAAQEGSKSTLISLREELAGAARRAGDRGSQPVQQPQG